MTAKELLKSVEGVISEFKRESGLKKTDDAITTLLSGLMVYCSENELEFEDFCDVADRRFDSLEAELNGEEGEVEDDNDEDEEDEVVEEDEEEDEEDEDDEDEEEMIEEEDEDFDDGDNGNDDDEAFDDGDDEE